MEAIWASMARPASVVRISWSNPSSVARAPSQSSSRSSVTCGSVSPNDSRCPASANSRARSTTVCRLTNKTPCGSASAGAVAIENAWPSTRCAADTSDAGKASVVLGSTIALGARGTPRSPTPVNSRMPPSASPVNELAVTSPVCCAISRNLAVTAWPAGMVLNDTLGSETSCAPEIPSGSKLMLTRLATARDVLVTVAYTSYGSPLRTVRGCARVTANVGFRTNTAPAAWPTRLTGPDGRPSSTASILMSKMCPPSFRPSSRNSPSPLACGGMVAISSAVPRSPSGPTCTTRTVTCCPTPSTRARRSGSSPGFSYDAPATRSSPVGSMTVPFTSRSTSGVPLGATLDTIRTTEKN